MSQTAEEWAASLDPHSVRVDSGRFASKLTFEERCSVLAAWAVGVNRRLLAVAFGIDRRTVSHVYNRQSPHYKDVRAEYDKLGKDKFIERYLTEDVRNKITKAEASPEAQAIVKMNDQEYSKTQRRTPNKRSDKFVGVHVMKPIQCEYSHRVEVKWVDSHLGLGWYYQDYDGDFPNEWMHTGEDSILTSKACYFGAENDIGDKINE